MTTVTDDEEEVRARPLPPKVAEAIDASFNEMQRLAEVAERVAVEDHVIVLEAVRMPVVEGVELLPLVERASGRDVAVISLGEATAVTRTERRQDDRFHLDLNVSLEGLDAYEVRTVRRVLTQHLRSLVTAARQENSEARITQLLRAVAPPDPLADVELKVAEATADLRREFLERVPVRTSAQVHERAGFPGSNPSQTVHRWRKQRKIFSVHHGGREWYPAFQFGDDGRPLAIIAELLAILRRDFERSDWDNALWFTGDSGWLDGKTPLDLLQSDPEAVRRAAEQEVLRDEQ